MQVTIDTRHDTLEEALAVIQMAFARTKDLAAAQGTAEATGPVRRRTASAARGGRGSRGAASAGNDAVAAPAAQAGSASQAAAGTGVPAAAVDDDASRRARATARKASTRKAVEKKTATAKRPTTKGSAKEAPAKEAVAAGSATKRAPASTSAGSRNGVASNIAPPGRADVVRAWARDQGMQVKAAGRMPAAVIAAYDQAHS